MTSFDARAREIAPCSCRVVLGINRNAHFGGCPARLQPAIAAALRECDRKATERCIAEVRANKNPEYRYKVYRERSSGRREIMLDIWKDIEDAIRATIKDTPDE